jgi:hypothetical protein
VTSTDTNWEQEPYAVVQVGEDKEAMQRLHQLKFKHKQERKAAELAKAAAKEGGGAAVPVKP